LERIKAESKEAGPPAARETALPVWRCKVCGYLCARERPPGKCPICGADRDRFEEFPL
jgi:rubrerythrin